ncbi:MAG: hypothetical protein MHMPM18_002106, partial [Marteilia pararefringens]
CFLKFRKNSVVHSTTIIEATSTGSFFMSVTDVPNNKAIEGSFFTECKKELNGMLTGSFSYMNVA